MGILVIALVLTAVAESGYPWGPPLSMITLYLLYGVPVGGIVAGLAMLAGAPVAWALGRLLVRTNWILVHIASYSALGAVIGIVAVVLGPVLNGFSGIAVLGQPFAAIVAGACGISVAGGWSWTFWQTSRDGFPAR